MRVLVACEFSGEVRDAFARRGHDAWSCDILPSETPGQHYRGDVRDLFTEAWDLIIAHPPCTYLCRSGHRWKLEGPGGRDDEAMALGFALQMWRAPGAGVALENPVGILSTAWRKPDQIIQPWMFGHCESKATCLWLRNLPLLEPTNIVADRDPRTHCEQPGPSRWKNRSRTLHGIAEAMAAQWSFGTSHQDIPLAVRESVGVSLSLF